MKAVDGVSFDLAQGRGARARRRVRQRQDDARPHAARARARDRRQRRCSRAATSRSSPSASCAPHRRRMQIVFQDPHASLNPAMTIGQAVGHPLRDPRARRAGATPCGGASPRRSRSSASRRPEQFLDKYPSDLSGGQKQRAVIARAIILNPVLLVADEPVSMLDMSVRAKILELMLSLKRDFDLTYLYITHDLATAKFFCDRIAIMYLGRIVEIGPSEAIYEDPKHPYTQALLRAIPEPDPRRRCRATCRAARCRTRRGRRSAARSTRAARGVRGLRLGGRATCATCSSGTGRRRARRSTRRSGRCSATSSRCRARRTSAAAACRARGRGAARGPRAGARGGSRRAVLEGCAVDACGRRRRGDRVARVARAAARPGRAGRGGVSPLWLGRSASSRRSGQSRATTPSR